MVSKQLMGCGTAVLGGTIFFLIHSSLTQVCYSCHDESVCYQNFQTLLVAASDRHSYEPMTWTNTPAPQHGPRKVETTLKIDLCPDLLLLRCAGLPLILTVWSVSALI